MNVFVLRKGATLPSGCAKACLDVESISWVHHLVKDVHFWRGAGAVELATLERWYTGNGIVGSNPTLSATQSPAVEMQYCARPTQLLTRSQPQEIPCPRGEPIGAAIRQTGRTMMSSNVIESTCVDHSTNMEQLIAEEEFILVQTQ